MEELTWCRQVAPELCENKSDSEVLKLLHGTWLLLGKDNKQFYTSDNDMLKDLTVLQNISDGARVKIWYTDSVNSYLFKTSKINTFGEYTYEHVSEYLAMLIAETLHIPCVDITISDKSILSRVMWKDNLKSFVEYSEEFSHSFHLSNLQTFNISTLLNPKSNAYYVDTIKMLLFDALIGNSDRHPGNFMYSVNKGLYPLFDNGSSLLCYVRDADVEVILKDKNRFKALCTTKSKPVLRDNQKLTHEQLVNILKRSYPEIFNEVAQYVNKEALLDCCDKVLMSDTHRKIVKEFLSYRAQWFGGLL